MVVDPDTTLPILNVRAGDVPERLLVVGDPARAERISTRLDNVREISRNREYVLYGGTHRGETVGVISHGVGSSGAAVCFEELCRAGAKRLIRAGTCGGMQSHIEDGTVIVVRGAVRDEGLTSHLLPPSFPAIADTDLVLALRAAVASAGVPSAEGIVLTSDLFYPHEALGAQLQMWNRAGVVAVEMECAALFITAHLHGIRAAAVLTSDGNPLREADHDMSGYNPHRTLVVEAVDAMIGAALDVVASPL
jgi:uridine phosphorylase